MVLNEWHVNHFQNFVFYKTAVMSCWRNVCNDLMAWNELQLNELSLQWCNNGRDSLSNHQPHDSNVYSDADERKHQSSTSLAFVQGIHRGPVNSPHKWSVTRKMFPFHDVIMSTEFELRASNHSRKVSHSIWWHNQSKMKCYKIVCKFCEIYTTFAELFDKIWFKLFTTMICQKLIDRHCVMCKYITLI